MHKLLAGKKALIIGVANERSIAYGVAKCFKDQGANIALTYLNENLKKRVEPIASDLDADFITEFDAANDNHFSLLAETINDKWGEFDILVHSIAFADRNDLKGSFMETSRQGFATACDISAYSLIALCNHLHPIMKDGGSVMAMSYLGSQKVVENYNVMGVAKAALEASIRYLAWELGEKGVRVNCVSPGPIKTLSASAVSGLRGMLARVAEITPLRKNITLEEIGNTSVYLASDLSQGVSGQIVYVDAGQNIMGIV